MSYLKWAGSKLRIIDDVLDAIGDCSDKTFIEPFVGSGNVALRVDAKEYYLSDYNKKLMKTHRTVITNPEEVINECTWLFGYGADEYYNVRKSFNDEYHKLSDVENAASFIYLNRHNFNGMYRENKSGGFNVPVNKDAKPNVPSEAIKEFSGRFNAGDFYFMDYNDAMFGVCSDDVVYVDPPYPAASISDSEISYTKDGFSKQDHIDLHDRCVVAANNGARVIVSYCDIKFIRELYSDADEIREVHAMRSISSKSGTRGKTKELIIIYKGEKYG